MHIHQSFKNKNTKFFYNLGSNKNKIKHLQRLMRRWTASASLNTDTKSSVPRTVHLLSAFTGCTCSVMVPANDYRFYHSQLSGALRYFFGSLRAHPRTVVGPTGKISQSPAIYMVRQPQNKFQKQKNLERSHIFSLNTHKAGI